MNNIVEIKRDKYFYSVYNDDAYIISKIMGYRLVNMGNDVVKAGFPTSSLEKVISILEKNKISYVVVNNPNLSKNYGMNNNYHKFLDRNLSVDSLYYDDRYERKVYQGTFSIKFEDEDNIEEYEIGININNDAEIVEKVFNHNVGDTVKLNSGLKFQIITKDLK